MPRQYIDELDDALSYERVEAFGGGMDAFTRSTLLAPDASQYLENVLIEDALECRTRPGADLLGTVRAAKIQGLFYFDNPTVGGQLFAASNGAMDYWGGSSWTAAAGFSLVDADAQVCFAQGIDKLLVCDGTNIRRWTGAAWDAAFGTGVTDPPATCSILLWHAGRMWASGFPGTGVAGLENDAVLCSALLTFGNGDWDRTNQSFRVGGGDGDPVIGLASIQDSIMAVLKRNSIWILNTPPQSPLPTGAKPVGESISFGTGLVGKRAFCVYGNDLLFVSPDRTFRSLQRMQNASGQYQLSAPLSLPIQPYVDRINWDKANLITVHKYKELALFSVPLDSATTPNYVFVWNGRLEKWVGIWSGWTVNDWEVTRFSGKHRLTMGDQSGRVRQWKEFADSSDDATYQDDSTGYATKSWTRAFLFNEPLNDKDMYHIEARFTAVNAVVNFTLMADNVAVATWSKDLRVVGPNLPQDLEFDLSNLVNMPSRKGLRGLTPFNEAYLKIESTDGWYALRNVSLSAYVNTLKNE